MYLYPCVYVLISIQMQNQSLSTLNFETFGTPQMLLISRLCIKIYI